MAYKNPADKFQHNRLYRLRYPERIREYQRRYALKMRAAGYVKRPRPIIISAEQMEQRRLRAKETRRLYRQRNRERFLEYDRNRPREKYRRDTLRKYGLTVDQFNALVAEQNGVCVICKTFEPTSVHPRLCVDHDHKTGSIRGLLCSKCNGGLGNFRDNIEYLQTAIEYLKRYSSQNALL